MQTTNRKNLRKDAFERIKTRIMTRDRFMPYSYCHGKPTPDALTDVSATHLPFRAYDKAGNIPLIFTSYDRIVLVAEYRTGWCDIAIVPVYASGIADTTYATSWKAAYGYYIAALDACFRVCTKVPHNVSANMRKYMRKHRIGWELADFRASVDVYAGIRKGDIDKFLAMCDSDRFATCKALVPTRLEYISNLIIGASSRRYVAMNEDI